MSGHRRKKWRFGWLLIALTSGGCEQLIEGIGAGSGSSGSTTTDIKRIVAAGPSLSFNALTAGVNAMALSPTTSLPAVAYYDKNSPVSGTTTIGALKFAYMDSNGNWNIEVVDANYGTAACGAAGSFCMGAPNAAAGGTASIIRTAFMSDGRPAIAYVYGASLATAGNKQIRFAERSAAGKWAISVVFSASASAGATNAANTATVDALKGLTLNFDSSDRPHVTFSFYAQTLVGNSFVKYAFRSSSGTWSVSDVTASVTAGTITGLTQGAMQSGAVFCPLNGMLLLATSFVDAAAGSGKPLFIRCTAVNSDGGCTTWSSLTLSNGCTGSTSCFSSGITTTTNAATRMDIAVDAATNRPIVGIYTTATPATTLYTSTAPNACDQSQTGVSGSWGAPLSVGATNEGQNGFRLSTSDSTTNLNFISYLDATTTVLANKSTGPAGAWFATGTTIMTTTVGAEGVGAAYDSSGDVLYTSFARLPGAAAGAVGNDIMMATSGAGDVTNGGAAGSFVLNYIDALVTVFPTTALPIFTAAKSNSGTVGYAYYYQDSAVADMKLYYGIRGGTASSPTFSQNFVTNFVESAAAQHVGSYPSLGFDSSDNPVIAYYNGVTADQSLWVARSATAGSTFSQTMVDDSVANVGQFPSVASSGSAIGVAYYDVTNTGLKFARWTSTTGWKRFAVDGMAGTGSCGNAANDAGRYARLGFSSTGRPVIVYQSAGALKIAYASEALTSSTYSWTCISLDSSGNTRGEGISLALDSSGSPHFAHFDSTAGQIRYVTCSSSISDCISTGASAFSGESVAAAGTTTAIITTPSIQVTSSGRIYIAHYSASYQGLALQTKLVGGSTWADEYIDMNDGGGSFISAAGQYPVLLLNSAEAPLVFYRSMENFIRYFSRETL